MNYLYKKIFLFVVSILLAGCATRYHMISYNEVNYIDSLSIREGLVSTKAQKIRYKRQGDILGFIELSDPVIVIQADQEEKWGFFQFPTIGKTEDGTLVVSWQMKEDSYSSLGTVSNRDYTPMMSKDGGLTWTRKDKNYELTSKGFNFHFKDGSVLYVKTPLSRDINSYEVFPEVVTKSGRKVFYLMDDLPDDLRGCYLNYKDVNKSITQIHAKLEDKGLLRYAVDGFMPIMWWGNIKQLSDNSLLAGVYPTSYIDDNGVVSLGNVSFYRSNNIGKSWQRVGVIPFIEDGIADVRGDREFSEPSFEVLSDGTLICVMRSGSVSPLYLSFSRDNGHSWTKPKPFTPNGVKPSVFKLENGILVLVSGRPGVQVRFSFDGTGQVWSNPIDMIPYSNPDGSYKRDVSCGYVAAIEADEQSFYIVYSDFTTLNAVGESRKTIWCRKITVTK